MPQPQVAAHPPAAQSRRLNLRQRAARRRSAAASLLGCFGVLIRSLRLVVMVAAGIAAGLYVYHNFLAPHDDRGLAPLIDQQTLQRQLILAKVEQQQVLDVGALVNEATLEWEAELERWDKETTALLKNDNGKALATYTDYVKRFRAIYDAERPGRGEAARLKALAEELVSDAKTARANPSDGWKPPEEVTTKLQELLGRAKEARDGYRRAREQIETLVSTAKASGTVRKKPLDVAIKEQADQEHDLETYQIAAKVREAQAEATRRLAEAKANEVREAGRKQATASERPGGGIREKERRPLSKR
jgi:hypothetical protein